MGDSDHQSLLGRFLPFSTVAAILAVVLRICAKRIQKIRLELNDYVIMLGLAFALAEVIVIFYMARLLKVWLNLVLAEGEEQLNDQNQQEKMWKDWELVIQLNLVLQTLWAIAVALIRSSIILLYIRIFPARSFRHTCYAILTLNGTFSLGAVLTVWLICVPIRCAWDIMGNCGSCGSDGLFNLLNATISLLLDITVVLLPTPVLWGLQMPVKNKVMISGMFGLGILICAITAKRLQLATTDQPAEKTSIKSNFEVIGFLMCLEVLLGVTTACLPVLKPIINQAHSLINRFKSRENRSASWIIGSIPIWGQVSQIWHSGFKRRAEREDLDSMIVIEDWRRTQSCIHSTPRPVRAGGLKESGIHIQREVRVESA